MAPGVFREALYKARLSQVEIASLMGVTPRAVSLWLKGARPIPGALVAYLRVFSMLTPEARQSEYDRARKFLAMRKMRK